MKAKVVEVEALVKPKVVEGDVLAKAKVLEVDAFDDGDGGIDEGGGGVDQPITTLASCFAQAKVRFAIHTSCRLWVYSRHLGYEF